MNFEPFNLNDHLLVKLNDLGFVTWKQEFEKRLPEQHHKPLSDFVARADADGYVDFQAWNFINLFGEHVYMAGPSLFDITILIQRPEPTPPPLRRPLSSLSDEEAREVYRLAFGEEADGTFCFLPPKGALTDVTMFQPNRFWIDIYVDGRMSACYDSNSEFTPFNAVAVVRYLDGLGIELG